MGSITFLIPVIVFIDRKLPNILIVKNHCHTGCTDSVGSRKSRCPEISLTGFNLAAPFTLPVFLGSSDIELVTQIRRTLIAFFQNPKIPAVLSIRVSGEDVYEILGKPMSNFGFCFQKYSWFSPINIRIEITRAVVDVPGSTWDRRRIESWRLFRLRF